MSPAIVQSISKQLGLAQLPTINPVNGGSINQTYQLHSNTKNWFCKVNSVEAFPDLFLKEAAGLKALHSQKVINVPSVVNCFEQEGQQVLLLEWITEGHRTKAFWQTFGEQLAALHHITHSQFGFDEDNYMGSLPQQNNWQSSWVDFFVQQRLAPMVKCCTGKAQLTAKHQNNFEKLYGRLTDIFNLEPPSLLHGDLWSGNFMCNAQDQPVLIDPAVYYGHRSVDLAMTTLFGGFDSVFYEAYHHHFPLPGNHKEQFAVANLYPLLIHLFLFGSGYLPQIERTLMRFA